MTSPSAPQQAQCPVFRSLETVGERWSLLIVRDAFDGLRRFGEFQKSLGLAKNVLAARLKALVEAGVFDLRPASDGSAYKEYVLTAQGRALFPVVVALRQWGEQHLYQAGEAHSLLLDADARQPLAPLQVRSQQGRLVGPQDCVRTPAV